MSCIAVIPARYRSTRLPGKPLVDISGKPMIQHVYERTRQCARIDRVIVATDDPRIESVVRGFGGEVMLTSAQHSSGSERVAEVSSKIPSEIVVNVQGDEPLIEPSTIEAALRALQDSNIAVVATAKVRIDSVDALFNHNVVKVVTDPDGYAIYFSRLPIPFQRLDQCTFFNFKEAIKSDPTLLKKYYKHIGLYVYRAEFLKKLVSMLPTPLERAERLEQLRILEHGYKIAVAEVENDSIGVDTEEDLTRVRKILKRKA